MFHEHYCSEDHQGIEYWSVTLIGQDEDLDSPRKKELCWINSLKTWAPNGLNVREVYGAYNLFQKRKSLFLMKGKVFNSHTHENVF